MEVLYCLWLERPHPVLKLPISWTSHHQISPSLKMSEPNIYISSTHYWPPWTRAIPWIRTKLQLCRLRVPPWHSVSIYECSPPTEYHWHSVPLSVIILFAESSCHILLSQVSSGCWVSMLLSVPLSHSPVTDCLPSLSIPLSPDIPLSLSIHCHWLSPITEYPPITGYSLVSQYPLSLTVSHHWVSPYHRVFLCLSVSPVTDCLSSLSIPLSPSIPLSLSIPCHWVSPMTECSCLSVSPVTEYPPITEYSPASQYPLSLSIPLSPSVPLSLSIPCHWVSPYHRVFPCLSVSPVIDPATVIVLLVYGLMLAFLCLTPSSMPTMRVPRSSTVPPLSCTKPLAFSIWLLCIQQKHITSLLTSNHILSIFFINIS